MNLEGNQRETSIQTSELESMTTQDPVEGRHKPRNHDETGSSRRAKKVDKPGNHDKTKSSTRMTKGDIPGNHNET